MQTQEMNGNKVHNIKDTKNKKEKKDFVSDSGYIIIETQFSVDDFVRLVSLFLKVEAPWENEYTVEQNQRIYKQAPSQHSFNFCRSSFIAVYVIYLAVSSSE